jgi:inorganic triphosphatase YgiF
MSDEARKPEREVHFYVPAHLEPPELRAFTVLETNRVTLTAVYWDTCDRGLLGWGHTVRHRTASDGGESGWTVKLGQDGANGAVVRDEIAFAGDPRQPPEEVCSLVRAFIRHKPLQPIATIITDRRSQRLRRDDENGVVEVANDLVRSCVGGNEGPTFREIEVELIEGDEDLLVDVVRVLRKTGLGEPDPASKLERVIGVARAASSSRSNSSHAPLSASSCRQRSRTAPVT